MFEGEGFDFRLLVQDLTAAISPGEPVGGKSCDLRGCWIVRDHPQVTLDEIEAFAREQNVTVEFTKLAEAREYRQTLAVKEQAVRAAPQDGTAPTPAQPAQVVELFPDQLLVG